MNIKRTSPISGKTNSLDIAVTDQQIFAWMAGTPIQRAMPNLQDWEREFIKTGITNEEWDILFKEPDSE